MREVKLLDVLELFDNDGLAVGLTYKSENFGMARLAENDDRGFSAILLP